MDSTTHLDYVVFQLTPTRTRCDLVMCAGNTKEKLASGLLEPFVSHLKSAKDQISKGGYSITLRSDGSWFTKATLERFVRFVSTPEVLERFVTLETEIQQIEKSIQSNEVQNNDAAADPDGNNVPEENSKVRLHRVFETRMAVLRKEQAMAYARALVAGFDLDYLDDLISFANAFGALRLREACIKFMELCKEKKEDRLWNDEIAAMEAYTRPDLPYLATSGVVLASDAHEHNHIDMPVTDLSTSHRSLDAQATVGSEAKNQVQYPWQNHLQQQYMYPQMAPYPPPGYVFPGMHSYYPNWPQADDHGHAFSRDSDARSHKSKKKHRKASEKVEEDESSSNISDSETDGEEVEKMHRKKQGKKSSRKVVIRNINYITSKRDGENKTGSSEGNSSDEDDNKAVGSFHNGKSSGSSHLKKQESENRHLKDEQDGWGAFESLLMREEEEPTSSVGVELHQEECFSSKSSEVGPTKQQLVVSDDSLVMIEKDVSSNPSARFEESESGRTVHPTQKKVMGPSFDDSMFLQKSGTDISPKINNDISIVSSSTRKVQRDGDWFIADPLNKPSGNLDLKVADDDSAIFGESLGAERKMSDHVIDDSFMVEGRVTAEDHELGARSMADISMVADIIEPTKKETSSFEPDELYMMLDRDNEVDHAASAWTQEMIFESNNTLLSEVNRRQSDSETVVAADDSNLPSKDAKVKVPGREARSRTGLVGRNKPDLTSRARIPTTGSRVPVQRGKNVKEEENRKRMEELQIQRQKRIAERSANNGGKTGRTNRSTVETKVAKIPTEPKKITNQLKITKAPKLPNPRSTIDRLAAARVTTKKVPQTNSKTTVRSTKAAGPKKPEASKKKISVQTSQAKTESRKLGGQEKETAEVLVASAESNEEPRNENAQLSEDFKDIKVLESVVVEEDKKPPAPVVLKASKSVQFKPDAEISFILSPGYDTDDVRELTLHPEPSPPNLPLQSSAVGRSQVNQNNSSTPPGEEMNSRKKWNGDEKSGKASKGLRKLLLFGKKSFNSLRN